MTLSQRSAKTNTVQVVNEVHLMQGRNSGRIDLMFTDDQRQHNDAEYCHSNHKNGDKATILKCLDTRQGTHSNTPSNHNGSVGRISFTLLRGHSKLHQSIDLPRFSVDRGMAGREIFAKWVPHFMEIDEEYLTDANGFDLVSRKVYPKASLEYFSSAFFPVDASITIKSRVGAGTTDTQKSLTVWNDRPQAGSVQYDKSIKLLIDRRVMTSD